MLTIDRFTQRSQDTASRAVEIMKRYDHRQIDTEHILLALLEQPEGVLPQILGSLNVEPEQVRKRLDDALRAALKTDPPPLGPGQVGITPRVFHMLTLADEEAQRAGGERISTRHMLLGLLAEQDTPVASILSDAGISVERVPRDFQDS